jgi:Lsr2
MAQQVLVSLVDDLDGSEGEDVATVEFGVDGVTYEIDLSEANADRLRDALAEFVNSARRTGGRKTGGRAGGKQARSTSKPSSNGAGHTVNGLDMSPAAIREWATGQGMTLADRGRIPQNVKDDYVAVSGGKIA